MRSQWWSDFFRADEGLNIFDAAQNQHNRRAGSPTDEEHFQNSDSKGNEHSMVVTHIMRYVG